MKLKTVLPLLFTALPLLAIGQNVGINTPSPQVPLHVRGAVALDNADTLAAADAITIVKETSTVIITDNSAASTNAITYSGGTPVEGQLLYILNQDAQAATFAGASIGNNSLGTFIFLGGTWRTVGSAGNAWRTDGNGGTTHTTNFLGTTDAQDLRVRTNNAERMRIDAAGNVGIGGATAPAHRLDVQGSVRIDGDFVNQSLSGAFVDLPLGSRQQIGCSLGGSGTASIGDVSTNTAGTTPLVASVTIPAGIPAGNQGVLINAYVSAQPNPAITFTGAGGLVGYFYQIVRAENAALTTNRILLDPTSDALIGLRHSATSNWPSATSITFVDNTVVAGTTYFYGISMNINALNLSIFNTGCIEIISSAINATMIKQ